MGFKKIILDKASEVARQSTMSKKHGAVIVKDRKIISSACNIALLPVTKKENSLLKGPLQRQYSL